MIKIAHRGNTNGPNEELENSPQHLYSALDKGFDIEVDVWIVDGQMYFGHDKPQHGPVKFSTLVDIAEHAWFHCKNFDALNFFASNNYQFKFFWHQDDDFTITSNGYIWSLPSKSYGPNSIVVDSPLEGGPYPDDLAGICSDWVDEL